MEALDLLSGDAHGFLTGPWASYAHVHKADADVLRELLSLDDVDTLLTSTALRAPALRVAQDGAVLPSSRFTRHATISGESLTGLVDARKVVDLYDGGATLVLAGSAPVLAAAHAARPRPGAIPRPPLSGERLPDASWVARLRLARGLA